MPSHHTKRLVGVDLARGIALIGMMAVHVFATFGPDGAPTAATTLAAGRSAATFVVVAGISLAFISGGQRQVHGQARTAVAAGIAVRGLLIGTIGLLLGYVTEEVILPYYAVLFLLAIPLLGLRPRTLALIAAMVIAVAPVVVLATVASQGVSLRGADMPTLDSLVQDPLGLIVGLLVTGFYPALAFVGYLCAGLALGKMDLSAPRVAVRLLVGGLGLAVTAKVTSAVVLFQLGGLQHLQSTAGSAELASKLLWDPTPTWSWWYLALPAPHSTTTVDMVHTLGSAMAVLGAALLLSRVPRATRLLRPLAAAGTMTLTLYCAHLIVLATGVLKDSPGMMFILLVIGALIFGVTWPRWRGQGPLERLVSAAAGQARRAVAARMDSRQAASRSA